MNTIRTITTTATAAILFAVSLAGCTPVPEHTASPTGTASASATPTASSTPTLDPEVAPTQEPGVAPTSAEEAIADATAVMPAYLNAFLEVTRSARPVTYMDAFVVPNSPQSVVVADTVRMNLETKSSAEGGPLGWETTLSMSLASPSLDAAGNVSSEFGFVELYGCLDNSKVTYLTDGQPNTALASGTSPWRYELLFDAESSTWKVRSATFMEGKEGAPTC